MISWMILLTKSADMAEYMHQWTYSFGYHKLNEKI
jgi:hypothetical protein